MSVWPAVPFENTKHPLVLSLSSCVRSNAHPSLRMQTELSRFASQHKRMIQVLSHFHWLEFGLVTRHHDNYDIFCQRCSSVGAC